ncbi:MAG: type IV pilus biogenesis/stability protein PilW [Woeseiaceae bacterium]
MKKSEVRAMLLVAVAVTFAGCVSTTTGPPEPKENDSDAAGINHQLAIQYFQNGNYELARDRLLLSTELDPHHPTVWSLLALTYEQMGNLRLAENSHQRALRAGPRNFDVQNAYAVYMCRQGRFGDAERQFEKSIRAETNDNPELMMTNAGMCYMEKPDVVKAEEWFRRALDRQPAYGEALLQMAVLKHSTGDNLRARAFLQRYLEANPAGSGVLYLCVLIEDELGDQRARTECANDLLRNYPNSPESRQLLQTSAKK